MKTRTDKDAHIREFDDNERLSNAPDPSLTILAGHLVLFPVLCPPPPLTIYDRYSNKAKLILHRMLIRTRSIGVTRISQKMY